MVFYAFSFSALAASVLLVLSAATLVFPSIRFWPPPQTTSWQYRVFWLLFRLFFLGIIVTSALDFAGLGERAISQLGIGATVAVVGFSLAFHATFALGWRDAHGEANSLNTEGWYSWSRNPVYVASIIGMVGVGMVVHSAYAYVLLLLWALMYIIAPFLEEPWLEQHYGEHFLDYKIRVNRFFGRRRGYRR